MRYLILYLLIPYIAFADGNSSSVSFSAKSNELLGKKGTTFVATISRRDVGQLFITGKVEETKTTQFNTGPVTTASVSFSVCQRVSGKRECKRSNFGGVFVDNKGNTNIFLSITPYKTSGTAKTIRPIDLILTLKNNSTVLVRVRRPAPSLRKLKASCGTEDSGVTLPVAALDRATLAATSYLTLYFHVDSRLYGLFGAVTPDIIAIALQSVASIYQSQLGLELRVEGITIFSDSATDPFLTVEGDHLAFLAYYRSYVEALPSNNADLFHLLTAQRGFVSAVGVAYTGTVCGNTYNSGFSDYSSGLGQFIVTIAHEIGHGLNASHDNNDTISIMSGNGGSRAKNPYFSQFSKDEISSFVSSVASSCLLDSTAPQAPTPSVPKIKRPGENRKNVNITIKSLRRSSSRGSVRGKITVNKLTSFGGRIVELRSYPDYLLVKTTKTNTRGNYSFAVSPSGQYYVVDRMTLKGSVLVGF